MQRRSLRRPLVASGSAFVCAVAFAGLAVLQGVSVSHASRSVRGTACTITGTRHDDVLHGTNGADRICAFAGNDVVLAANGDDIVFGGDGSDRIYGGVGSDRITGGYGLDALLGGAGVDIEYGGSGHDMLYGGEGGDSLYGGLGANRCPGQTGDVRAKACRSSAGPAVVLAAGDIACAPREGIGTSACAMRQVADRMRSLHPWGVLTLGDNQYEEGAYSAYERSYARSWGRLKAITFPSAGNHEYMTHRASGYYRYFGPMARQDTNRGYYSSQIGAWHLIALNSNCGLIGGCGVGDKEYRWLSKDLARDKHACTLAYWHHPRYTAGEYSNDATFTPFWHLLFHDRAEIVLNGHDHNYQRYSLLDAHGRYTAHGIREFVVGTGGRNTYPVVHAKVAHRVYWNDSHFGVLKLVLSTNSYTWKFITVGGKVLDSGSGTCRG
jgi:hypothetical protein